MKKNLKISKYSPKRVLAVFAHPDDEAFGPSGTLTLWIKKGATVHLLSATRGESGMNELEKDTAALRVKELQKSAKIIGIKSVEFLGFYDGRIGNNDLASLQNKISQKIDLFKPDTLVTFDLNGISGHLDHIAVSSAATSSFFKSSVKRIYYLTNIKEFRDKITDYFIYMPEGKTIDQIDEVIDISSVWDIKSRAVFSHQSQKKDIENLMAIWQTMPKKEYFIVKKNPLP